jgi:choline dehydrogenase-like flavoprotein
MANNHFDIIIKGTGIGGGTIAQSLADTGKKSLILERGRFIQKEKENWEPRSPMQWYIN